MKNITCLTPKWEETNVVPSRNVPLTLNALSLSEFGAACCVLEGNGHNAIALRAEALHLWERRPSSGKVSRAGAAKEFEADS